MVLSRFRRGFFSQDLPHSSYLGSPCISPTVRCIVWRSATHGWWTWRKQQKKHFWTHIWGTCFWGYGIVTHWQLHVHLLISPIMTPNPMQSATAAANNQCDKLGFSTPQSGSVTQKKSKTWPLKPPKLGWFSPWIRSASISAVLRAGRVAMLRTTGNGSNGWPQVLLSGND